MIRAVMEGICYSLNSVMAALKEFGDVKDIRVSGSFTKSKLWLQIYQTSSTSPLPCRTTAKALPSGRLYWASFPAVG